ncbi:hypothetical protein LEMLEM_LOCUS27176, partial [Lemmus lemmus]
MRRNHTALHPDPSWTTRMSLGTCSAADRSSVMSKSTALAPRSPAIRACGDTAEGAVTARSQGAGLVPLQT